MIEDLQDALTAGDQGAFSTETISVQVWMNEDTEDRQQHCCRSFAFAVLRRSVAVLFSLRVGRPENLRLLMSVEGPSKEEDWGPAGLLGHEALFPQSTAAVL